VYVDVAVNINIPQLTLDTCRVEQQMLKVEYDCEDPTGQEFRAQIILGQQNFEAMCLDSVLGIYIFMCIHVFLSLPTILFNIVFLQFSCVERDAGIRILEMITNIK
jgi:hypothetical protein